jgi:hypothetical protein
MIIFTDATIPSFLPTRQPFKGDSQELLSSFSVSIEIDTRVPFRKKIHSKDELQITTCQKNVVQKRPRGSRLQQQRCSQHLGIAMLNLYDA